MSDYISRQAAIDALKMDISIIPFAKAREYVRAAIETIYNRLEELPPVQPTQPNTPNTLISLDCIDRQVAIDDVETVNPSILLDVDWVKRWVKALPPAQLDQIKYEYHYDHTDCIWYRPEARNRCPVTCAQYRDGWNDAMNYIFRDGKGYRPYRRDEKYE